LPIVKEFSDYFTFEQDSVSAHRVKKKEDGLSIYGCRWQTFHAI